MADLYLETRTLNHNFEEFSYEKVFERLYQEYARNEEFGARAKTDEEKSAYEKKANELANDKRLLTMYSDEFPVLDRIRAHGYEDDEAGRSVQFAFKEIDFRKPEIVTEKHDVEEKNKQLELECTFENGLKFGLSAIARDGAEDKLLTGQISLPNETLEKLNAENLARIMDFCERYGFSTYDLTIPMREGMVAADEKIKDLAALLESYKEKAHADASEVRTPATPSDDEHDMSGFDEEDYHIVYEGPAPLPGYSALPTVAVKSEPEPLTFNEVKQNFRSFIEKDLHKKLRLSYWEHTRSVDGQIMTVFSIYDKEDRDNYKNDGKKDPKKKHVHVPTFSYRLYVAQKSDGRFIFGYATPNGKKMDDVMAGDFIGEIKKTGTTHLNLKNIPNQDKMVWMVACAEKGIVPTGISINKAKAEKMLQAAQAKLSTQEFATFERRLMEQLEAHAKAKGKELPTSEQEFIEKRKNEAQKLLETQQDMLKAAEFERDFHNFRRAYDNGLKREAESTIAKGIMDAKTGPANAIGAMTALTRTFDAVLGDDCNMDISFAERLDQLMKCPIKNDETGDIISVRLTQDERRVLSTSILLDKKVKDMTSQDWQCVYEVMFKRAYNEAKDKIIAEYRANDKSASKAIDNILINRVWKRETSAFERVNSRLSSQGCEELKLPKKDGEFIYQRPKELTYAYIQEQEKKRKAAEEAAATKAATPAAPDRSRGGM